MGTTTGQGTKYTREILLDAVAVSRSFHDVLRHLGTPVTGGSAAHVARRIRHFDIEIGHFTSIRAAPEPLPELSRSALLAAVQGTRNLSALARRLNLPVTPRTRRFLQQQLTEHGLDLDRPGGRPADLDPEFLRVCAAASTSLAGMMRLLGIYATWTNYRRLHRALDLHAIDTSHFARASWRAVDRPSVSAFDPHKVLRLREPGSGRVTRTRLHRALAALGREEVCASCGVGTEWRGRRLSLEIDHINGDFLDNRPENLRYLCPNCHATTPGYCRRKHPDAVDSCARRDSNPHVLSDTSS